MNDQHQTVIECYEKAFEIATEGGDKLNEINMFLDLGLVHDLATQNQTAINCWEIASKLASREGNYEELKTEDLRSWRNLANSKIITAYSLMM